jgi:hypothetical protein
MHAAEHGRDAGEAAGTARGRDGASGGVQESQGAEAPQQSAVGTQPAGLRLLPWPAPNGGPSYTPDDCPDGLIAHMADDVERDQLKSGAFVLKLAGKCWSCPKTER